MGGIEADPVVTGIVVLLVLAGAVWYMATRRGGS